MAISYLFRIDAAKDNDAFFDLLQPSVSIVYAGVDIRIGSGGWVPDFIKVTIAKPGQSLMLTLIELETTKSDALISYRKYLPENSAGVVEKFRQYLDRVINRCRTTADPRKDEFVRLKEALETSQITVTTAGALRSAANFVEELPLIGQTHHVTISRSIDASSHAEVPCFRGSLRLSALEAKRFGRTLMILDALIRERDHSVATFKAWRQSVKVQPLKHFLKANMADYPCLRAFLSGTGKRGITLDCNAILSELVEIWSNSGHRQFDEERARNLIMSYFPIAAEIGKDESMRAVFDNARHHIKSNLKP